MKISIYSLNKYLKPALSTDEIAQAIERTEIELEEVIKPPIWDELVIVAQVLEVNPHPNADRLRLALVTDSKKTYHIVCGAPNLAEDQIVVLAKVGAVLPDQTKIAKAKIRGELSEGMLCSAAELGINDDHNGLMELSPDLPLGKSLCDIENFGDILDIKTHPNRWDTLSLIGLAREISANSHRPCQLAEPKQEDLDYDKKERVKIEDTKVCSRMITVHLKLNNAKPTPKWLVDNLESNGLRSINPVVDITNFVMLEYGQPSHAYDANKLQDDLQVRWAKAGESLPCLDGKTRQLVKDDLVIADSKKVVGIAGVIGGSDTECDTNTTEVVLEVANFDKTVVRKSALRNSVRTEASSRFERGLPLPLQPVAANRLVELMTEICDAEMLEAPHDQLYVWPWVQLAAMRMRRAEKILGMEVDEKQILDGLTKRGFEAEHFSLTAEAKKHLGKPYKWGASYKVDGEEAFDCSYLTERIYSKLGLMIGHSAYQQSTNGRELTDGDRLKPGDLLFVAGGISDPKLAKQRHNVSHVAMFLGSNKVIEAKKSVGKVRYTSLQEFKQRRGYIGARRYLDSFNHIIAVQVPWWRSDIKLEEDLIEESVKIVGYDNMPDTLPSLPPTPTGSHQQLINILRLKQQLVDIGAQEVVTYSFVSEEALNMVGVNIDNALAVANPLQKEQALIRTSLMPSHLQVVRNNQADTESGLFFEISRIQSWLNKPTKVGENWALAATSFGSDSYTRLKAVLDKIGFDNSLLHRSDRPDMIKGRQAIVKYQGHEIGVIGQLHPRVSTAFGVRRELSYLEINIADLRSQVVERTIRKLPAYPLVLRDLTVECNQLVLWQDFSTVAVKQSDIVIAKYIGEYQDDELKKERRKRITIQLVMDLGEKPDAKNINAAVQKFIAKLSQLESLADIKVC